MQRLGLQELLVLRIDGVLMMLDDTIDRLLRNLRRELEFEYQGNQSTIIALTYEKAESLAKIANLTTTNEMLVDKIAELESQILELTKVNT
jgi:hypothetical protein